MAGLQDTKRRITSVESTKKITKAMELVSTAKLKKARTRFEESDAYFSVIIKNINDLLASKSIRHKYVQPAQGEHVLYIVISSDLGLCGGYNQNVYKAIREANALEASYAVTGNKASSYYRYRDANVVLDKPGITSAPQFSDCKEISDFALDLYSKGEIDKIVLVYTKFVNSVTFEPTLLQLLPVEQNEEAKQGSVEYEPSPEVVLEYLIPKYVESTIYGGMIESLASEQASRRMAMENATDNAEEIIDKLTVQYNRARQAAITQEISEIVAGADAL